MSRIMIKKQANHNPSLKMEDIRLCERQYLIQGLVTSEQGSETEGGIWIPFDAKKMKVVNSCKVLAVGPGCTRAKVGEYVVVNTITGENFYHLKPQPIHRHPFDEDGLNTIHEDLIRAVIPEAQGAPGDLLEEKDGKDIRSEEGGPLRAVDPEP